MKLLVVVASSLQDGCHLGIIVIVSLHCCCRRHPLVVNHCCWILAIIVSLCCCCRCCVVATRWSLSQDGHRHKMVIVMVLMLLSLCVAVVIVVPLLSIIVFVGLLDVGHHPLSLCVAVVVVASSSQDGHHHGVVVVVSLCCCCCRRPLVCQPLFLLDCWILAIVVISLCWCHYTIVFVVAVVVCFRSSSLSLWLGPLSIDISLFLFCVLFHVLIEFEISDRENIEK